MSTPTTLVADRYRLVKLLGSGGMGIVWQAWDERLQRPVALKMLRSQPELTDQEREITTNRAMREARITAGLHHRHAVTVFDVVEHEGQPCLVMELIESTPLSVLLREHGTLTPRETARIGAQVSSALAVAHKMRIVHRDVKPGNILITEDGSAMISDFGISHALGDATITATGMIHGTPAYLAPEVARGWESSFASDVFSLGSTLYAMLEGTPPFGAENNAIALLHKVARGDYPAPKHAAELTPLLRDMLAADPKRRPDMRTIATRLSAIYEGTRDGAGATAASESPMVPLGLPAAGPRIERSEAGTAEAEQVGVTAETEPLDETTSGTERLHDTTSDTDRLAAAVPEGTELQDGPTVDTVRLHETRRYEAPTLEAPTVEAEAPTVEAPTAETERLVGAAASPAAATSVPHPPLPPPAAPTQPDSQPRRRRAGALIGIVLIVGILVLGIVVLFNSLHQDAGNAGGPSIRESPSTNQASATAGTPTASETPTAGTQPPETQSPATPPAPVNPNPSPPPDAGKTQEQRLVDTITTYYSLMPGNLDSAWPMMTADYQENHVGGRDAYESFWGDVENVTISDVSASPPDAAQATLTYYFTDGRVVQEVTAYRFAEEEGALKIAETTVLSSREL
jgi:serine/threonine protein kinase